ncbi:bL17 family ribosomal protein [Candidatus Peribacteria bacterium]|nr:MAG: bL17 family ribosomal protein [Candidatus Peribacteria bacterium]
MRKQTSRLRLTQKPAHSRLLQRNLVTSLFLYEAIRTTKARARIVQTIVDRLISTAKRQETHVAVRSLNAYVTDTNASRKVMEVLRERYKTRTSGFTTLKAAGARKGDGAQLVDLMLIDAEIGTQVVEKAPKAKKTPAKKTATSTKAASEPVASSSNDSSAA